VIDRGSESVSQLGKDLRERGQKERMNLEICRIEIERWLGSDGWIWTWMDRIMAEGANETEMDE